MESFKSILFCLACTFPDDSRKEMSGDASPQTMPDSRFHSQLSVSFLSLVRVINWGQSVGVHQVNEYFMFGRKIEK